MADKAFRNGGRGADLTDLRPRRGRWRYAARIRTAAVVLALALSACAPAAEDEPVASVDDPQVLTNEQAEALALMPFRAYSAGVVEIDGQLFGAESGDMGLTGWVDLAGDTGYAAVTPAGAQPVLVVWSEDQVAFLDVADVEGLPPATLPDGDWQVVALDAGASELTRMLSALLLVSADRPENPQLLRQNGARYLGVDEVDGEAAERYSGVSATGAGGEADLGTQYWLDPEGALVRFGIRLEGSTLSTVDVREPEAAPDPLPLPEDLVISGIG